MRTINFISENQKQAVVLGKDNNLVEYLADLEKRIPERKFDGLSVQYNKDLSIAAVNGLPFEQFLSQNPVYNKTDFEQQFKYCCIANNVGGNYVTLDVTVEQHFPKNTNAYSTIDGFGIERKITAKLDSEDCEKQIKEAINAFEYYSEEDPKGRKFTSLIFEVTYFRFSGHQFPVRVKDLTGQFPFLLAKSARFVYEFDFDNEEELMTAIYMATKPTNLQLWQEPVSE
ncbi:hypothetical protein ACFGY2_07150 [Pasteurella multocida]|nr:hypothetical protein [Pasteurella multocida]